MNRRMIGAAAAVVLAVPLATTTTTPASGATEDPALVALTWQRIAIQTVPFSPATGYFLAVTSKAVDKAATQSLRRKDSSEAAAVAQAAHDVLAAYFPGAKPSLDQSLADTLGSVPDGAAEDRGTALGAEAAEQAVAARDGDGRGDPSIAYSRTPGIGVWQPDARGFAAVWMGFIDRFHGERPVVVDGPDPVGSPAYRADLAEVQATGVVGADATKAATARFWNVNAFALLRSGLIDHLESSPPSLAETTALFADLDIATAEAMRQAWRHKFNYGFWRPVTAITVDDADPLTTPVPGWTSVLPVPPYPDWPSGHGTLTGVFAETLRCHFGDLALTMRSGGEVRSFATLAALEREAALSRIWGGIHFRDAMDDAYHIGHVVAGQVCR